MAKIKIFVGHFGSGKTEIAVNYALKLARENKKVTLVDIDIVNPYFCSRDLKDMLEEKGVKVIASNPHYSNAELMVVPPEVISVFNDDNSEVIFDVGGDDMGAVALGRYNRYFVKEGYQMLFVINTNRPFTNNENDIKEYIDSIEKASRLKITELISNTNLSYDTSVEDIMSGESIVKRLSKELKISHDLTVVKKDLEKSLEHVVKGKIFPINLYMKPFWREE